MPSSDRLASPAPAPTTHDDPRVPGSGLLQETLVGFTTSFVAAGLMASAGVMFQKPFIFPSLGATVFLLFYRSQASAAAPRNTILGHLIGVLAGLLSLSLFGLLDQPSAFEDVMTWGRAGAAALSLGLTTATMTGLRLAHPPAGATTLIVSLGLLRTFEEVTVLMAAIFLIIFIAAVTHRLFGTAYPLWRPFAELPAEQDRRRTRPSIRGRGAR